MQKRVLISKTFITFITSILFILVLSCENSDGITSQEKNKNSTIVEKFGQLSISGSDLVDKNSNIIVLRGMSLYWSQWAPNYYNEETIKWLRDDWKCTVVRVAMGIEEGGYLQNPASEYQKITTVIEACIKLGIYVIVDWHDHHGEDHLESANSFFHNISLAYGNYQNIIYEIYNEPLDVSWVNVLKPHSEIIISTIRKNDPDNIIVVGTPNWSQDVDDVLGVAIEDDNVCYSLHFYTGTHRDWLRKKADQAMFGGVPLFVSEWGLSEANGNGNIDITETNLWTDFMELKNLSWCNWSLTNKDEVSAVLIPSTSSIAGWSEDELSEAGKIIRDYLIRMNTELFEADYE